ncbi:MAG: nitrogen-fixing protein NifU [Ignavibacteria bacterium]|nr:nitrogen-fixing protein NifU [Ignavibacteria bacterium]
MENQEKTSISHQEDLFNQVHSIIEKDIRPYIEADGGRIHLKGVVDGEVFVQLSGACAGCPGAMMTLKGGVEKILKIKVPEIKTVKLAM